MLQHLYIKEFALIDELRLDLCPGLNILTGETGAGKSIVIDSINLILGDRVSTDVIRTGKDKAVIEAVFDLSDVPGAEELLDQIGVDTDEVLVVSREISSVGRNTSRVNGRTVTQAVLKEIGELLIDIHGQHEHQSLLNPDKHIDFLDRFGGAQLLALRAKIESAYGDYRDISTKITELNTKRKDRSAKIDYLQFQKEEIERANLTENEEDELDAQRTVLANAEKIFTAISSAYNSVFESDGLRTSAVDAIGAALNLLNTAEAYDTRIKHFSKVLAEGLYLVEDAAREMRDYIDAIDFSPERLAEVEERLDIIKKLKRKHGCNSIKELIELLIKIDDELEQLNNIEYSSDELEKRRVKLEHSLIEDCKKISELRKKAACLMEDAMTAELKDMGMEKTKFKVNITWIESPSGVIVDDKRIMLTKHGFDSIEFLISPNPGEPLKPLSRIISGGEMSRVMLAIKNILAKTDNIPTMVFDEIDTGISGRTAQKVAEKLAVIAKNRQVICVTHLPQIASMADRHFYIEKKSDKAGTTTHVNELKNDEEKAIELARMLGGVKLTETTKNHAKEMLQMALKIKQDSLRT